MSTRIRLASGDDRDGGWFELIGGFLAGADELNCLAVENPSASALSKVIG